STVTLAAALRRAGLKRVAQPSAVLYAKPSEPAHYGYSDSHRLEPADPGKYTSCLTDAEWALAADLFERPEGHRGRPAVYERRRMV
ncbi:IS5/IS1182 family transposase, partial [Cupriavidus sp. CV2]|nr:IS5/IS1182 family transposase [Cupriavidus sp. CV2]